jgi:hypothetical protein
MNDQPTELFDMQSAPYALQTYYGYVRAWTEKIGQLYGRNADFRDLRNAVLHVTNVEKLQGGTKTSQKFISAYSRGKLTLKAMASFPINENKQLASTANLWLPVQAYYAIHGAGLAAMISLGQNEPKDHRAFRASFADFSSNYLPPPFNSRCTSGPTTQNFIFKCLETTPQEVIAYNSLSNPRYSDNLDCALGKCLSTTRNKFLEEQFDKARHTGTAKKRKRRNLSTQEKNDISIRLHSTSLVDFLYRMRVRSNYDDPDIYIYAHSQVDDALRHYNDLVFLTAAIFTSLSAIIMKKLGKSTFERIESQYG